MLSLARTKSVKKKKTIILGLNSENSGREILLRLLVVVVKPGDNVLAIHVQEQDENFDPNTFHIHKDLCKSKQVDFQIKICYGDSYISELTRQMRVNYATILVLGSGSSGPKDSVVKTCLKGLPPTCTLLVMDHRGKIQIQMQGTSQEGSTKLVFKSHLPSPVNNPDINQSTSSHQLPEPLPAPSSSTLPSLQSGESHRVAHVKKVVQIPDYTKEKLLNIDLKRSIRLFTPQEIAFATKNFCPAMLIAEGGHYKVYKAKLEDGRPVSVKVQTKHLSSEDLLQEIGILAGLKHENIIKIIGCCNREEIRAIVYDLLKGSLKQHLRKLRWTDRMKVAIGMAKALKYLHHSCSPPIIHRDIKSSNILLSNQCEPLLSDFGAAMVLGPAQENSKQCDVVGSSGKLAPEYMMYGKVDEKIDVYSYGVVLLELITGKHAIQTDKANCGSLVIWAGSLLGCNLADGLIDPYLKEDYNHEEMERVMIVTRLCLLHSSSRRPTMENILRLFEEPEYLKKMQRGREELLTVVSPKAEMGLWKSEESAMKDTISIDDDYGFSDDLNLT